MSLAQLPESLDALWRSFRKLVRAEFPDYDLVGAFEYRTLSVSSGLLSAQRIDSSLNIPDVVTIPIRSGIPGCTVVPLQGSTVYVFFANRDPSKPRVFAYDNESAGSVGFDCSTGNEEHLTTTEAMALVLANLFMLLGSEATGGGATGAAALATFLAALSTPLLAQAQVDAIITASTSGPTATLNVTTMAAIAAALAAKTGDSGGTQPNIGCPNLKGG